MIERPYRIVAPCSEPVRTLYRDAHCWVVEKPSQLLSVPGRGPENHDSVTSRLQQQDAEVRVVHRLDLDTSGLMVFACTAAAQRRLNDAFAQRQVDKTYEAVVAGAVRLAEGEIDLPLRPDWLRRPRQKVCHRLGKPSLTRYKVLASEPDRTRLALYPITGRSHQLRLHLRAIGHPILGCDLYAPLSHLAASPRLLLHATALGFAHPEDGRWMTFESQAPF